VIVTTSETAMAMHRPRLNTAVVDRHLQARRALAATATSRRSKRAQRQSANERTVEAIAHAIRGEKK
jgi:hypothetical protein